jgi:hypothetical protein
LGGGGYGFVETRVDFLLRLLMYMSKLLLAMSILLIWEGLGFLCGVWCHSRVGKEIFVAGTSVH